MYIGLLDQKVTSRKLLNLDILSSALTDCNQFFKLSNVLGIVMLHKSLNLTHNKTMLLVKEIGVHSVSQCSRFLKFSG